MYTRLLFLDAGFVSIEAATADEGLGIPERDDVRLVFTDVEIPGSTLNGLDLVEVVRKNGRGSS
jgi:YesN/AraC family two-component response regulator